MTIIPSTLPTALSMAAHVAALVPWIFCNARQLLTRARRFDHCHCAVAGRLCQLRVERDQEMQALAGVGIHDAEQRSISPIEIGLINCDLSGVDRIEPGYAVALDCAPAFSADTFVLPGAQVAQRRQLRTVNKNAVRMATEQPTHRLEAPVRHRSSPVRRARRRSLRGTASRAAVAGFSEFDSRDLGGWLVAVRLLSASSRRARIILG